MFSPTIRSSVRAGLLAGASLFAGPALADDQAPPLWDINVGAGGMLRPTFDGSDRYRASPVPLVSVRYNDMVTLGPEGISAYWRQGAFKIGAGLTFDPGRDDHKSNGLFNNGDDRLKGLGDIDKSLGFKVFGGYELGRLNLDLAVAKYTGDQNDGLLVTGGMSLPLTLWADRLTLTPHVDVTWANDSYTQTYFGVTRAQAANSGFAAYTAGSGFKDIGVGVRAKYRFNEHWSVTGDVTVKQLLGDAADSPITYSATSTLVMAGFGYRF
ncbi:MipA/OmpV family protein [Azospirillum sp. B4]|uniref:MipA/OmpV family protein n=1 Tax=Azospirillum sp. B4 TaxID=95605 RepID=UPI00034BD97A|nr:MipA/OmpV family protein [Azospirillum sp. B4]